MNRFLSLVLSLLFAAASANMAMAKDTQVKGYTKKDGTVVAGYTKHSETVKSKTETKDSKGKDTIEVKGYTKKDGTVVKGYTRKKSNK